MTDPDFADSTYIEPMNAQVLEDIIEKERPDALLPTLGGQTGLNLAMELCESGFLTKAGVELIGANAKALERDTRGFISIITIWPSLGFIANWTLDPPVSTPIRLMQAKA